MNPYQPPGNPPPGQPPGWGYGGPGYPQGYPPPQAPFGSVPFGAPSPYPPTPEQAAAARRAFAEREISDYATWSLINGITALFICGLFTGPFAVFRGSKALRLIEQHDVGRQHAGKAKAGRALGFAAMALWLVGVAGYFVLVAR